MLPIVARWKDVTSEILGPCIFPGTFSSRHDSLCWHFGPCQRVPINVSKRCAAKCFCWYWSAFRTSARKSGIIGRCLGALMGAAHAAGWPIVRGGSQRISDALALYLSTLDGRIVTNHRVDCLDSFTNQLVLCDVTPRLLLGMARNTLPDQFCRTLREYRYGPGIFKEDWALDGPIPWRAPDCLRAATVHLGGTWNEVSASEASAWTGRICDKPFVILTQPSLFDHTRTHQGMPGRIAIYRTDRPWT